MTTLRNRAAAGLVMVLLIVVSVSVFAHDDDAAAVRVGEAYIAVQLQTNVVEVAKYDLDEALSLLIMIDFVSLTVNDNGKLETPVERDPYSYSLEPADTREIDSYASADELLALFVKLREESDKLHQLREELRAALHDALYP